jgi:hypothetical protein
MDLAEGVQFCGISVFSVLFAAKHGLIGRHKIKTINTNRENFILFKIFGLG